MLSYPITSDFVTLFKTRLKMHFYHCKLATTSAYVSSDVTNELVGEKIYITYYL